MSWVTTSGGVEIPEPSFGSGTVTFSTLVNAGRNANGKFVGQVIGGDKMKVEMSWEVLTPEQFATILQVFDRNQGGKFVNTFTVYDPRTGTYVSKKMYVGDRSGTPIMVKTDGHPTYWTGIKVDLIEV